MKNIFQEFNQKVSLNTRMFVLLAISLITFMVWFNGPFVIGGIISLLLVVIVEYFQLTKDKYKVFWNALKWLIILALLTFTLVGFLN
jgi:hypothetical protein